ncbi:hypothetical protein Godav_017408, partial [Gossypium davidsonii]|nr:hypothetical protein [Gossypium davidsonii]
MKESLISRLPMLDGSNYAYWKACMMVFIKFMDEKYNDKLVHKVPKSLQERFSVNVTTINEAKDINTMRIDELI